MDNLWRTMKCHCCNGIKWGGDSPEECDDCKGGGGIYIRPSGHAFLYPGGPALGMWGADEYEKAKPCKAVCSTCGMGAPGTTIDMQGDEDHEICPECGES